METFPVDPGALIKEQWLRRNGVDRKQSPGRKARDPESACPVMRAGEPAAAWGPDKAHPETFSTTGPPRPDGRLLAPLSPPTPAHHWSTWADGKHRRAISLALENNQGFGMVSYQ